MKISLGRPLGIAAALVLLALQSLPALSETRVKKSSFGYDDQGFVIRETVEPDIINSCLTTNYTLDGFGNKISKVVSACSGVSGPSSWSASARSTATTYSADGIFPLTTTNALGHTETREFTSNGQVRSLVGPNGLATSWEYDGLGRKTKELRADGTYTTWGYYRCPHAAANCPGPIGGVAVHWVQVERHFRTTDSTNWPEQRQYFDALNRVLRVQKEGFTDSQGIIPVWVQDTEYDARGRVKRKSNNYDPALSGPIWTEFFYDQLDRVVEERQPDPSAAGGIAVTFRQFNGLTTVVVNPKNQSQQTIKNAQGKVAAILDANGGSIHYTYDAEGMLVATNANGSVTTLTYDQRGNKIGMVDPVMGAWTYSSNVFGNLVSQTDSLGRSTTLTYDKLGRLVKRVEPNLVSEWSFDKKFDGIACGKGIGSLCEAKADNGYRRVNEYDALGRTASTSTTLDNAASPATVSVAYGSDSGRVIRRTWPTGFQASYTYTSRGYPKRVTGGGNNGFPETMSMQIDAMDANGNVTGFLQGDIVSTAKVFDQATGRFTSQVVTKSGAVAGGVLKHAYTYDALDNLASRQDSTPGVGTTESFSYDNLNRLQQYLILGGGVSPPKTTNVLYDPRGNITYKSDVGQYVYDSARPNRLQSIALTSPSGAPANTGTRALSFAYDDAGGQVVNGVPTGNGSVTETISQDAVNSRYTYRRQTYTSFNMPLTTTYGNIVGGVAGTAERTLNFTYGPEHQRIKQQVELAAGAPAAYKASTTWYLNGEDSLGLTYEKEIFAAGMTEHRHFLSMGGVVFAVRSTRSGSLSGQPATSGRYFHHDHLGSIAAISDETGTVVERLAFDPWGKRRQADGNSDPLDQIVGQNTSRGFTMHEHLDEVGTVHMNGRVYDPLIGRFLSADSYLQSPGNLQSYNRYSYVLNNPLHYTDPSGHSFFKRFLRNFVGIMAGYFVGPWVGGFFGGTGAAGNLAGNIASGFSGGFTAGVIQTGTLKGGLYGGLAGGAFEGIGFEAKVGKWSTSTYVAAHAAVGCVTQSIAGGSCKTGALSAGFAKWATVKIDWGSNFANGVKATLVGGTASIIGGGKFEDGALTAAYGYVFNELMTRGTPASRLQQAGYSETSYSDGTYCNIQGGDGSCGFPGVSGAGENPPVTYQLGVGAQAGAAVMGGGLEGGVAVSSTFEDLCVYAQFCGIAGPQLALSVNGVASLGQGYPSPGPQSSRGFTVFGGDGIFGSVQGTQSSDGQLQGSRGIVRGGLGAGAGAGYVECRQMNFCVSSR